MPSPYKVIINSLPKAGTNMVSKLLDLAGLESRHFCFDSQIVFGTSPLKRAFRDLLNPGRQDVLLGITMPVSVPLGFVEKKLTTLQRNQYFKAHVGRSTAFLQLLTGLEVVPVIVLRDPRDVIISLVHFGLSSKKHPLRPLFEELGNPEARIDAVINGCRYGDFFLESIQQQCESLDPWLNFPKSIVVKFEDLVGEKGGGSNDLQVQTLTRLFNGLGLNKTASEISEIAEKLHGPGRRTFRKGVIGEAWKEMTPDQLKRLNDLLAPTFKRWGYLPYQSI